MDSQAQGRTTMRQSLVNTYRRVKTVGRILRGRDSWFRTDVRERQMYLGSGYGGWSIATDYLNEHPVVYSFGIGEDISFDLEVARRFGASVYAFDPTPRSIEWLKSQELPEHFHSFGYGLADFDGTVEFHPPADPRCVSHSFVEAQSSDHGSTAIALPVRKLQSVLAELRHSRIDILKMDIEGAEYSVIEDLCTTQIRPTQILVEFHHRFDSVDVRDSVNAVNRLREVGYQLFSVSSTNEEFSFIYKGQQQRIAA